MTQNRLLRGPSLLLLTILSTATACSSSPEVAEAEWFSDVCNALDDYNDSLIRFIGRAKELSTDYGIFIESNMEDFMGPLADDAEELKAVVAAVEGDVPSDDEPFYNWMADLTFKAADGARQFVEVLNSNSASLDELEVTTAEMVSTLMGPGSIAISEIPDEVNSELVDSMATTRPETLEAFGQCSAFDRPLETVDPMDIFPFPSRPLPTGPSQYEPWTAIVAGSSSWAPGSGASFLSVDDLAGDGWELIHEEAGEVGEGPLDSVIELMSGVCEVLVSSSDPPVTINPEPTSWEMVQIERPDSDPGTMVVAVEEYADSQEASDAFDVVRQAMGCFELLGMETPPWDLASIPSADLFALRTDNSGAASLPQLPGLDAYDEAPAGISDMAWIRRERWVATIAVDPYGIGNGAAPEVAALLAQRMTDGD